MMLIYRGIRKHKRWSPGGHGSICPDWTHRNDNAHYGAKGPEDWEKWSETMAQSLLNASVPDGRQRYAAANGIAFCAQEDSAGCWHGYPIPWRKVPQNVVVQLLKKKQVTRREYRKGLRQQKGIDPERDKRWARSSDDG